MHHMALGPSLLYYGLLVLRLTFYTYSYNQGLAKLCIKRPSQKLYKTINQKSLPVTHILYLATYYIHRLVIIDSGFELICRNIITP